LKQGNTQPENRYRAKRKSHDSTSNGADLRMCRF
jgi:hypothetical protein